MKTIKYLLSAVLVMSLFLSCTKNNFTGADFLSNVQAPSNVSVLYDVTQDNTGAVTLTPNGEGVVSYDIYFGDGTTEPVSLKQGKNIKHTFLEGSYNVKIVAFGITGLTTEVTVPLVISFRAPENLQVTIENDLSVSKQVNLTATADFATSFKVFFGESADEMPLMANVGETVNYTYQNAGTYTIKVIAIGAAIATTEYTVDFDVTAILQPLASAPIPPTRSALDVISIYGDSYTNVAGTNYNPDWGQSGQGSSFAEFDLNGDKMLQYINLSYQGIEFASGTTINASAMEFLHVDVWTTDVTDLEISLINTVDEKPVTKSLSADQWNSLDIPLTDYTNQGLSLSDLIQLKFVDTPWATGTIFVDNIYFYVQTPTAPSVAAPTPTAASSSVTSIFSDTYTNITVNEWNPAWGQNTVLTNISLSGNNILKYDNLDFTGIVTDYGNPTNLSNKTYVHFDYWTKDATSLAFKMVNTSYTNGDPLKESEVAVSSVTTGSWVGVDIPLSSFTTDKSGITQMLFSSSGTTVYIDNLYFYSTLLTAPTTAAPTPTVSAASVVSIYSDTYTNITVNQWNPVWGQNTVLVNINIGGNNTLKYSNLDFTGIVTDYGNPTNVSAKTYIHFDYWATDATSLAFKIENTSYANGDSLRGSQVAVSSITTGSWVSVDIPLSSFTTDMSGITQMLFVSSGATVYIDNIYFY